MIPKVIHYCWFGRNPLPESALKCISSWRKFFPNYEIKEWNEDNFDVNIIPYTYEAYRLKKYAFVSDYARFWILYHYGGLYFDTDVEAIKPMDDIIERGPFIGIEAGHEKENSIIVAPGLGLGCYPGHGFYKKVLDDYESSHFVTWDGKYTGNICGKVSNLLFSSDKRNNIDGFLNVEDIFVYPDEYFCPVNYYTGECHITDNTRTIHHYTATWRNIENSILFKLKKRIKYIVIRVVSFLRMIPIFEKS